MAPCEPASGHRASWQSASGLCVAAAGTGQRAPGTGQAGKPQEPNVTPSSTRMTWEGVSSLGNLTCSSGKAELVSFGPTEKLFFFSFSSSFPFLCKQSLGRAKLVRRGGLYLGASSLDGAVVVNSM